MDYEKIKQQFIKSHIGEIIITDTELELLSYEGPFDFDEGKWESWRKRFPFDTIDEGVTDWEIGDKETGTFFRIHTLKTSDEGETILIHHVFDISDYAGLFQELSRYSHEWRTLSSFQSDLMQALSDDCTECLPIAVKYLKARDGIMFVRRGDITAVYECTSPDENIIASRLVDKFEFVRPEGERCKIPGRSGEYECFACDTTVSGDSYALYLCRADIDDKIQPIYYQVLQLYIENALMREKIVYENEHDNLTGLFNRAKYSEMVINEFPFYDSISVFFMDLNYLKRTNDTLGHEAGNTLIKKAGRSIDTVLDEGIYGFRIGGDEFVLVATDTDEKGAEDLKERWIKALDEINKNHPDPECVIACGVRSGTRPYDLKQIIEEADQLMYENKRAIKIARGDDPDGR